MSYFPKQNKKAALTAVFILVLSVIVLSLKNVFPSAGIYVSIGSVALLTASLFITIRFVITHYAYEITSDSLIITKTVGQRKQTAASILLKTGKGICQRPKSAEQKREFSEKFGKTDSRLSFTQNIFCSQYVYVTEFNGRIYEILLECDDEFAEALNGAVLSARENHDDEFDE